MKACIGGAKEYDFTYSGLSDEQNKNQTFDLIHLLKEFSNVQTLDEENEWYCPSCKEHVRATVKLDIYKVPEYLLIHMKKLKGFSPGMGRSNRKDKWYDTQSSKSITFPIENLDMTDYVLNKESIQDYNITVEEFKDDNNPN